MSDLAGALRLKSAPEEGGEPVAGAGRWCRSDRRREQGVAAGARDQHRGYYQQGGGQGARDRLGLPARPGYVPPVDGDLEGRRGGHNAGRQRAAGDLDDLALLAGPGPGVQQRAAAVVEGPGRVSRDVAVLRRRGPGPRARFRCPHRLRRGTRSRA